MITSGTAHLPKIKEITSLTFFGEVGPSFCLNYDSNFEILALTAKNEAILLKNQFSIVNHQNIMNVLRFRIPLPDFIPTKRIKVEEQSVYDGGGLLQKRAYMMDQNLIPKFVVIPYIASKKLDFLLMTVQIPYFSPI